MAQVDSTHPIGGAVEINSTHTIGGHHVFGATLDVTECTESSQRNLSQMFESDEVVMVVGQKRLFLIIQKANEQVQYLQFERHTLTKLSIFLLHCN